MARPKKRTHKSKKSNKSKFNSFSLAVDIIGAPLRGLKMVFGKRTGSVVAVGLASMITLSSMTVDTLAKSSDGVNKALGDFTADMVEASVEERYGKTAAKGARRAMEAINAETDPQRCETEEFRAGREEEDCREDQIKNRGILTAAVGSGVALASLGNDAGDAKGKTKKSGVFRGLGF